MRRVKEAYSLSVFFSDHCNCVHIALEDDQNRPFATAVPSHTGSAERAGSPRANTGASITMLDFNRVNFSETPLSIGLNELIERSESPSRNVRQYLGASAIGSECLRKIQFDWMCDPVHPVRTLTIFARGHFHEKLAREHLMRAGFKFCAT